MHQVMIAIYVVLQIAYLFSTLTTLWFLTRKVDLVQPQAAGTETGSRPDIILFYPVLRELEETMRTTFLGMAESEYAGGRFRVVSIPNSDDLETIASLRRLQQEFSFLEVLPVPPTNDPSWNVVWSSWDMNAGAYWWHHGRRAGETALPAKKTRQLIWAMYQLAPDNEDSLLSYIDADSVIPRDYWTTAAVGMQSYDVIQNTNITGNLLGTWPSSFYAMDHISWDSSVYKHMTAGGAHPFYVLGKGLFFRFRDLLEAGGFHPWLTIEDPEIGMRLWTNGARLGVVESPLVEEVPATWAQGVTQRKRWVAGFFQSLASPLVEMGMPLRKRMRARLNFVPCLSLLLNPIGLVVGAWVLISAATSPTQVVPGWAQVLTALSMISAAVVIGHNWIQAYRMTAPVLDTRRERLKYWLRVNPLFMLGYWLWWTVPLVYGFWMFLADKGLTWERTEKRDANHVLIRGELEGQPVADPLGLKALTEVPAMVSEAETLVK